MSDIEIANTIKLLNIENVARKLNIDTSVLIKYGDYKAKINIQDINKPSGKLILVTSINPTPAGEGKTTVSIGLADGLQKLGKKVCLALREPSLGPVFGLKGGGAGGGYAQVAPMEDINLHFNGDFHAITSACNLLSAAIDNHLFQGNSLQIDKVIFKNAIDMNDRSLRIIKAGIGDKNGIERESGFEITVASEVMAILCLAENIFDLKLRLGKIIIGFDISGNNIYAKDLNVHGAMTALLKDAIKPNLVQTLEHTPAIIHGGPFANIAHGCNSIIATKTALSFSDYTVTEAGFGSDLGAEKFLDIKCRIANLKPNAVVIVATIKALKYHGGVPKENLSKENPEALELGLCNLKKHVDNITNIYKLPVVIAINKFQADTDNEISLLQRKFKNAIVTDVWSRGGEGAIDLAEAVVSMCDNKNDFTYAYELTDSLLEKIKKVCTKIYGAKDVVFQDEALKFLELPEYQHLPICIAKTPSSLSDNPSLIGVPTDFTITVKNIKLCNGAGFIVIYAGNILTMPGLPKTPAYETIDIDENGEIIGVF